MAKQNLVKKIAIVGEMCDGWEIQLDGKTFCWNHNDDRYILPLLELLEHLGFNVEVQEWY